jgi:hypothetical protein
MMSPPVMTPPSGHVPAHRPDRGTVNPTSRISRRGFLLTVWYERMKESPMAVLRQARWVLV